MRNCISWATLAFGHGFSLADVCLVLLSSRLQDPPGAHYLHARSPEHLPGVGGFADPGVGVFNTGEFSKVKVLGLKWSLSTVKDPVYIKSFQRRLLQVKEACILLRDVLA